jgi:predicted nucleic acid-binding protein
MKIVVDSNIVFSAMLNTKSRIGQIITIGTKHFEFYSVNLLKTEIFNHKTKIQELAGFDDTEFEVVYSLVTAKIRFVDEILLSNIEIERALKLTKDIDEDDTLFVALTNHLKAKLWTGDQKLEKGLNAKEYYRIISTRDLYDKFIRAEMKRKKSL